MRHRAVSRGLLVLSIAAGGSAFLAASILWFVGQRAYATPLFLFGLSLGPCLTIYALVPTNRKQPARRLVLITGGLSILAFSILGRVNIDLEGFFMLLFLGTGGAAAGHTLVTVVLGPLFFGRFLCGWGCWRAMILEQLPIRRSPGRRSGAWNVLPLFGLALSISAAAVLVFRFGQHPGGAPGAPHSARLQTIVEGFGIYYAVSIALAFALRDSRAFCKYLCPSGVILGLTSRFSLLKMKADGDLCNDCGACSKICPMDIDVAHFALLGQRVKSGQCILCQQCAHACPTNALHLVAALDVAGRTPFMEHLSSSHS